jgi:hypothetical protein
VVASDTTQTYHVAVVGYLAAGLLLTTSSVNALVYSSNGAREAAAAGFILLSMVAVCISLFLRLRVWSLLPLLLAQKNKNKVKVIGEPPQGTFSCI